MNLPVLQPSASPRVHAFESRFGAHVLVVDGSRVFDLELPPGLSCGDLDEAAVLEALGDAATAPPRIGAQPLSPPPLASLSLNVSQACNMSCGYCYADEGRFGGSARVMTMEIARAAIDRLLSESEAGASVLIGFMGGEPLLNREVLHGATAYADAQARRLGRSASFSVTTNGSRIRPEDARLFQKHRFTVAVSVDGCGPQHDSLRKMKDGSSGFDRLLRSLEVLRRHGRPAQLSARVTVTPRSGRLLPILEQLLEMGFDDVGFSPVVVSPDPSLEFTPTEFEVFLGHMIECGRHAVSAISQGRPYPFSNLETALQEIHRGSHRPYPCGAGAGYLSVNAEGDLFACHRLVDDPGFAMGDIFGGSDYSARSSHLARQHVDGMEPCRTCWARYLCGGGCYHEVARRGRPACDYIRGWLEFCLQAYVELGELRPGGWTQPGPRRDPSMRGPL